MLLILIAILALRIHSACTETVTVNLVCPNEDDDCEKMELGIKSEGGVSVDLVLMMTSELKLADEVCHYYRVAGSTDFGSIRICDELVSGSFSRDGGMYVLRWDPESNAYDLTRNQDEDDGEDRGLTDPVLHCAFDDSSVSLEDDSDDGKERGLDGMDEESGGDRAMGQAARRGIIEVLAFADYSFFRLKAQMNGSIENATKYVADIINAVDAIYQQQLDIRVYFAGFRIIDDGFGHHETHIHKYLDSFTQRYQELMAKDYESPSRGHIYGMADVALLFTNKKMPASDEKGTVGVANLEICKETGTVVVKTSRMVHAKGGEDNKYESDTKLADVDFMTHSVAHELAHTLGVQHDNFYVQKQHRTCSCSSNDTCLMSEYAPMGNSSFRFSECSRDAILKNMESGRNGGNLKCLFRQDLLRESGPSLKLAITILRSIVGMVSGLMLATAIVLFVQYVINLPVDVHDSDL